MTFVVRMESEHVASLTATKELLIRIREAFGCDCQALIDDMDDLLFRAEREQQLPPVDMFHKEPALSAAALLALARERGLMPDEPYELDSGKHSMYHSLHADRADMDRKRLKEDG